jgi:hypothetical protein
MQHAALDWAPGPGSEALGVKKTIQAACVTFLDKRSLDFATWWKTNAVSLLAQVASEGWASLSVKKLMSSFVASHPLMTMQSGW